MNRRNLFTALAGGIVAGAVMDKVQADDALVQINRLASIRPSQIARLELVRIWPDEPWNGWLNVYAKGAEDPLQTELRCGTHGKHVDLDPECPIDPLELKDRLEKLTGKRASLVPPLH